MKTNPLSRPPFWFAVSTAVMTVLFVARTVQAAEGDLTLDQPATIGGVQAACTGVGEDARSDPQWKAYPLRVEVAGAGGQFLGDMTVSVKGKATDISVRCSGPWALFQVPTGQYRVTVSLGGGAQKNTTARVGSSGQSRVILHFPTVGTISPEGEANTEAQASLR
jgi:hypothetical protein